MARSLLRFLAGLLTLLVLMREASAQTTATWNNTGGGSWTTTANWTGLNVGDAFPDNGQPSGPYNASFPAIGLMDYTVTVPSSITISNLTMNDQRATVVHQAGAGNNFTVTGGATINYGTFRVDSGNIGGGTWIVGSDNAFTSATLSFNQTATLSNNVTLRTGGSLQVEGGNTLTIGAGTTVLFSTPLVGIPFGGGSITSDSLTTNHVVNSGTITTNTDGNNDINPSGNFTNNAGGIVRANAANSFVTISPGGNATNSGILEALNGGVLQIFPFGTFSNLAGANSLRVDAFSELRIGTAFSTTYTTADIDGKIERIGGGNTGTIRLGGTMTNSAAPYNAGNGFMLSTGPTGTGGSTGTLILSGGTITGGIISTDGTAVLKADGTYGESVLSGVTLNTVGVLDLTPNFSVLRFRNGTQFATIAPADAITLGFSSTLIFDQNYSQPLSYNLNESSSLRVETSAGPINTLTIAAGEKVTYAGAAGASNFANVGFPIVSSGHVINNGTIDFSGTQGATINIGGVGNFTNTGLVRAVGGNINIQPTGDGFGGPNFFNTGTLEVDTGRTLIIGGGSTIYTTADIDNNVAPNRLLRTGTGGTVHIAGTMDNSAYVGPLGFQLTTANTGSLNLGGLAGSGLGGIILGGRLSTDNTAFLRITDNYNILDGVTLNSINVLDWNAFANPFLHFRNGTQFDPALVPAGSTIALPTGATLELNQNYSQDYNYTLADGTTLRIFNPFTLTINAGRAVTYTSAAGGTANLGGGGGGGNIINNGTIGFGGGSHTDATLFIDTFAGTITNNNLIRAVGGHVVIRPNLPFVPGPNTFFNTTGTLEVDSSHTLSVGGQFNTADLDNNTPGTRLVRTGGANTGRVEIIGVMDNSAYGAGFLLTDTNTGTLFLGNPTLAGGMGGTIVGGRLTTDGTAFLGITDADNTLDNVNLGSLSVLQFPANPTPFQLRFRGGTTIDGLPGTINVNENSTLRFDQSNVLDLNYNLRNGSSLQVENSNTFTIAAGRTVSYLATPAAFPTATLGGSGDIVNNGTIRFDPASTAPDARLNINPNGNVVNNGLIHSNYANGTISIFPVGLGSTFTNNGILQASGGGAFEGAIVNAAGGRIRPGASAGTFSLNQSFSSLTFNAGSIYEWELAALTSTDTLGTPGVHWDQIVMESNLLTIDPNAILEISFLNPGDAPNMGNPFWDSTHTWKNIIFTPTAFVGNGSFTIDNSAWSSNPRSFFTINDPDPGVTLVWGFAPQPVPEPGSLLLCGAAAVGGAFGWWRKRRRGPHAAGTVIA